ncbi:hypothetical protein BKA70DRAFT_483494 [Coprinopsis sp. MPI-PUGE-AT-0042]|nr:hypothetical protein BKA70DRAFT_483494 [Coprinopsis sp. MPI-PUGE-AT-0042]
MLPSHDTLVLKREVPIDQSQNPFFVWTRRGNAQTRTQGSRAGETKDQCLFLRGFLITASPAVWTARAETPKVPASHQDAPDISRDHIQGPINSGKYTDDASGKGPLRGRSTHSLASAATHPLLNHPNANNINSGDITVCPMPPQVAIGSDYPSLRINRSLLYFANAKYAITHDDDWREAVMKESKFC